MKVYSRLVTSRENNFSFVDRWIVCGIKAGMSNLLAYLGCVELRGMSWAAYEICNVVNVCY